MPADRSRPPSEGRLSGIWTGEGRHLDPGPLGRSGRDGASFQDGSDESRLVDSPRRGTIALERAGRFVVPGNPSVARACWPTQANAVRKLATGLDGYRLSAGRFTSRRPHDRRDWPSSEVPLGMRLSTLGPALARIGIEVRRYRGRWPKRERMVSIRRISADHRDACEEAVQGVQGVQRRGNGGNGRQADVGGDAARVRGLLPPGPRGEA